MSILDTTIVAVALATLARDFHDSVTTIQWVATAYLLALALVTPVSGWAVDRYGAKRGPDALHAPLHPRLEPVRPGLVGRLVDRLPLLQGVGGGMLLPVGQSMLARAAGPQRMGPATSIIGVPMVMGPVLGPVLGGLIISNYSWRWIFDINVPIGIVTLILSQRWLPRFDTASAPTPPPRSTGWGSAFWAPASPPCSTPSPRSGPPVPPPAPPSWSASCWGWG